MSSLPHGDDDIFVIQMNYSVSVVFMHVCAAYLFKNGIYDNNNTLSEILISLPTDTVNTFL